MPDNVSAIELSGTGVADVVPFTCDLDRAIFSSTVAVATNPLVLDIQKNGSGGLFTAPVAKIAVGSPLAAADTSVFLEFINRTGSGASQVDAPATGVDIGPGEYLKIGSEYVQVTTPVTSGTGLTTGGVQGSSKVDGGNPVYKVGITRGALSTTPADAAAGTDVLPLFVVPVGALQSFVKTNPVEGATPTFTQGDEVAYTVVSGAAPTGTKVTLEVSQR